MCSVFYEFGGDVIELWMACDLLKAFYSLNCVNRLMDIH